ncbi:MAG: carboxypeptidase-like regulatory domain-containing protein [Bacteroidota bacterium]
MRNFIILLLCFAFSHVTAQNISGVVWDPGNQGAIPFVNIWIKDKRIGTTSDENGQFFLKKTISEADSLVFSAIGYEVLTIPIERLRDTIFLKSSTVILDEIEIVPLQEEEFRILFPFEKRQISRYYACGTNPWIVARFFPYDSSYSNTPFLNKIRLVTDSDVKNTVFNLRLYTVGENGKPDKFLRDQNILVNVPKGKKWTTVNLSAFRIKFPEKGFFVGIEWLIIEENKHEYEYTKSDFKKKYKGISYEPAFGSTPKTSSENSWIFREGKWLPAYNTKGAIGKTGSD